MEDKNLMAWGGVSALVFVVLLSASIIMAWVTGEGIAFRGWVPLWSTLLCFLVVAALAGYDYLAVRHYALARVGMGFAGLAIITFFLEGAVWGADRIVLPAETASDPSEPSPLLALFNSLHAMVLWFVALWMASWGSAFVRLESRARLVGGLMLLLAVFNGGSYLILRLGVSGPPVDLYHLGGQVVLLGVFAVLGVVLLETSRKAPDSSHTPG